ncbi:hypothetical protein EMPS_09936 [Entomortierella parvispora]|uniref:Uncharacterized protein n=1 Tax=Entomortierella parvispora TaxID=205924 RepID=A0A9P3HJ37_9FUNG|nr:hypothetical protein EMPS_09936 [Entomortierella parvispora]
MLHGAPTAIISDRDTRLTIRFWQELHKLMDGCQTCTVNRLQPTDGWTGRGYEQYVEDYVETFIDNKQSKGTGSFRHQNSPTSTPTMHPPDTRYSSSTLASTLAFPRRSSVNPTAQSPLLTPS